VLVPFISAPVEMRRHVASPALIVASFVVFGAVDGITASNEAAGGVLLVVHWVLVAFLLFWWASADALRRRSELSTSMITCLVVFGFLAMPFYLAGARPSGSWMRWLPKGLVLFSFCLGGQTLAFGVIQELSHAI
jgi:hypothetical protein